MSKPTAPGKGLKVMCLVVILPPKRKDKYSWNINLGVWKSSYGVIIKI